ncbi:MAG: CBS domain-containing protein [Desulfobacterales bacterium]
MFVSRSMTQKVITTTPEASVFDAYEKMSRNRIRHLPVIDADERSARTTPFRMHWC